MPNTTDLRRTLYNAAVYSILVEECSADPDDFVEFNIHFPECGEYRFIGNQGFGGKVWSGNRREAPYVTNYAEDDNPERKAARDRANAKLKEVDK